MKNNTFSVKEINKSFPYLKPFQGILIKIKYTTEILLLIRAIMSVLSSAAMIPIVVLFIYNWFKRLIIVSSVLFTTSFAPVVISDGGHNFSMNFRNLLEYLSITFHNWLFNDNLLPSHARNEQRIEDLILNPVSHSQPIHDLATAPRLDNLITQGSGQELNIPLPPTDHVNISLSSHPSPAGGGAMSATNNAERLVS